MVAQGVPQDGGFGSFTIVDVETSGLRASDHRILSVAALTLESDGRVAREFHTLLDPGCDPGPVHVHGLTAEILRGSPRFEHVREQLSELLTGRVMVAHNAGFDYGFLMNEFDRSGGVLPVGHRLCTLALARRVAPPTPDCKLGTLASYYGVPRWKAHDALDDTRVLAGVFRALVADAARLGVAPPLLRCPPKENSRSSWRRPGARSGPKTPCEYSYPGVLGDDGRLVQGMKVAFTGETETEREALIAMAEAAGLDVTGGVSGRTSLLVTNTPHGPTGKARRAAELGTPIISERRFVAMLGEVRPGRRKDAPAASSRAASSKANGPLAGRRILVLGGAHGEAANARARVVELGGSAAVNMSARVTDVLALPGADGDRRHAKAIELGLPVHGPELLSGGPSIAVSPVAVAEAVIDPIDLARGQVIDLPIAQRGVQWQLRASWTQSTTWEVDLIAFLVDGAERVSADEDFVFYNQPRTGGAGLVVEGPSEQSIEIDLDELPVNCRRIVVAAALDSPGVTFGDIGAVEIELAPGGEAVAMARATLDAATEERTLLLAEVYLRGDNWRLRAIGQGYATGLAALARSYGVEVDE
ncbi:DNA polymerase-3 subunit epsilon [Nocardia amikacinitolerans]|uniref:TerD family protein n=1 Tax=Nocardia amikacinitolerans TaxID=756689 RepID=UPI000A78EF5C|nr:TerD family protein [Nocardia amikacinitolerans]MCP2318705.1 DNA polymerase-3 subunit epsilon [Nocardia amikacinitolerans]